MGMILSDMVGGDGLRAKPNFTSGCGGRAGAAFRPCAGRGCSDTVRRIVGVHRMKKMGMVSSKRGLLALQVALAALALCALPALAQTVAASAPAVFSVSLCEKLISIILKFSPLLPAK